MKANFIVGIAWLLLISSPSLAADENTWDSLSASQQTALARFSEEWDSLPPLRRERLLRGAEHWASMSPQQRREARARF